MHRILRSARPRVALTGLAAGVAVLAAACGSSATTTTKAAPAPARPAAAATAASTTIAVKTEAPYGTFLTTAKGYALYTYTADLPGGPGCTGECLHVWPPLLLAPTQQTVPSTGGADFATLPRSGRLQATFHGLPLYTYIKDTAPGMVTGQNVIDAGGKWILATVGAAAPTATPAPAASSTTAPPATAAPTTAAPATAPVTVAPSRPVATTPAPTHSTPTAPRVTAPVTAPPTTRPSAPATTVPPVGPSY